MFNPEAALEWLTRCEAGGGPLSAADITRFLELAGYVAHHVLADDRMLVVFVSAVPDVPSGYSEVILPESDIIYRGGGADAAIFAIRNWLETFHRGT